MRDERGQEDGARAPAPGTQVAGFTLQECLATGSSGRVYRAERGGRRFAIKLVPMGMWGEREVDALRRVRHPSVVELLGYGQWPEAAPRFLVLALEWVDGPALDVWAQEGRRTAWEQVEQVLLPVVEALGEVHAAGVVHRDVKEANIVMRREDGRPVLVDFGAARYEGAPRLTLRLPPGTPEYRSPEMLRFARQWDGEPYESQPADDLWALGVTLYVLLTRTLPFGDRHGPLSRAILEHAPEPPHLRNPRVPPALGAVCLRMLEKAPDHRYADALAVAAALREALAQADDAWRLPLFPEDAAPGPAEPPPRPPASAPRSRWRSRALLLLGLLLLGLLSALVLRPGPRGEDPAPDATTPRARSPEALPSPQAGLRQELAALSKTAEVGPSAEPLQSPPSAPTRSPHREDDPMRTPSSPRRPLLKSALLSAACVGVACVSAPPPRPRPPAECPPGHDEALENLGVHTYEYLHVILAPREYRLNPGGSKTFLQETPHFTASIFGNWKGMPDKTELEGTLFFEEGRVHAYFTLMRLPSGEVLPACLRLTDGSAPRSIGVEMLPGSKGSRALVNTDAYVYNVSRFY